MGKPEKLVYPVSQHLFNELFNPKVVINLTKRRRATVLRYQDSLTNLIKKVNLETNQNVALLPSLQSDPLYLTLAFDGYQSAREAVIKVGEECKAKIAAEYKAAGMELF